jgi:hypothetical protein
MFGEFKQGSKYSTDADLPRNWLVKEYPGLTLYTIVVGKKIIMLTIPAPASIGSRIGNIFACKVIQLLSATIARK